MFLRTPAGFLMALVSLAAPGLPASKADPPSAPIVWDRAVDGLEPGFLLATPGPSAGRRTSLNSRVDYKVLVRNVSDQERVFEISTNFAPYLIPDDSVRDVLHARVFPERFRALSAIDLSAAPGGYEVKLAPGESIVAPGEMGLYLGAADPQSLPRVETVQTGKNWIVQPIGVHVRNGVEKAQFEKMNAAPYVERRPVTVMNRDGKPREVTALLIGGHADGKRLFARIQIEVEARK